MLVWSILLAVAGADFRTSAHFAHWEATPTADTRPMEAKMNLSGPKRVSWWIALIIWIGVIMGAVGVLAYLVPIPALSGYALRFLAVGWLVLAIMDGVLFRKVWS